MTIRERNMQALEKFRPAVAESVKSVKKTGRYRLFTSSCPEKYPNMHDSKLGIDIYDKHDPVADAKKLIDSKNILFNVFEVILGFGLGYEALHLAHGLDASGTIMIVEPDAEAFAVAIEAVDFTQLFSDPRIVLYVGEPIERTLPRLHSDIRVRRAYFYIKSVVIVERAARLLAEREYLLTFVKHFRTAVGNIMIEFGNDPYDSLIGIYNTFQNIDEIIDWPGINTLKDKFRGRPGIVVSTGPSLNKNIHLLEGLYDKAVFCAADASVWPMKRRGLKPHLVTALERLDPTAKLLEGLTKEDVEDIYFSPCPVIHPKTYSNWPGEKLVVYRSFSTFEWLGLERGTLRIGPSAGNMAFKILEYLGCDPIILVGQDLAYSEDGQTTHATGSVYGEHQDSMYGNRDLGITEVPGNYVDKIKTNRAWKMFLEFYHNDVMNSKARVINATEGGAKINGAEIMTLQEAIDQCIGEAFNPVDAIKTFAHRPSLDQRRKDEALVYDKVKNGLAYVQELNATIRGEVESCRKLLDTYGFDYDNGKNINVEEFMEKAEEVATRATMFGDEQFYLILMHYVQSFYIASMNEFNHIRSTVSNDAERGVRLLRHLENLYKVIHDLSLKMQEMLAVLNVHMEERRAEEAGSEA